MSIRAADAQDYIDLARLGRTGFWVGVRGFVRIVLYFAAMVAAAVAALKLAVFEFPEIVPTLEALRVGKAGPEIEFAAILVQSIVVLWAVHDATVRTQRRPFLSLVSPSRRIEPLRVLAGAVAALIAMLAGSVLADAAAHLWGLADDSAVAPEWHAPGREWLIAAGIGIVIVPLQAGGEELLFRGWLTQTLGQAIRWPPLLALIVGLLFALMHAPDTPASLAYYTALSLGFSAVSLSDGRLELAIGAHIAQNLFVLLVVTPFLEGTDPTLLGSRQTAIGAIALTGGVAQSVLLYALTRWPAYRRGFGLAE